ncbi:hypothetical protein GGF32_004758 [Allomyces javanicus]|nr:hypothetical protein GGF32_004758 [Allomyces javanicus]
MRPTVICAEASLATAIVQLTALLTEKEREVRCLRSELGAKAHDIVILRSELDTKMHDVFTLRSELDAKMHYVTTLHKELETKKPEPNDPESKKSEDDLGHLHIMLAAKDEAIDKLKAAMVAPDRDAFKFDLKLAAKDCKLQEARREIAELKALIAAGSAAVTTLLLRGNDDRVVWEHAIFGTSASPEESMRLGSLLKKVKHRPEEVVGVVIAAIDKGMSRLRHEERLQIAMDFKSNRIWEVDLQGVFLMVARIDNPIEMVETVAKESTGWLEMHM